MASEEVGDPMDRPLPKSVYSVMRRFADFNYDKAELMVPDSTSEISDVGRRRCSIEE